MRLFITRVDHTKEVEVRIMKLSTYGSIIPLVFVAQVSSQNSMGMRVKRDDDLSRVPPEWGPQTRGRWEKISHFPALIVNILKMVADTPHSYY